MAIEASSNVKHEFLDGQIYAMAGGTPDDAALAAAVIGLLFPQIRRRGCRIFDADLRVRVLETGLTTYPDSTIVCGTLEHDPDDENAVTNPTVIVEVLSRNTEAYDRTEKFEHYQRISSLREYVLVSHRERSVEVWTRGDGDTWTRSIAEEGTLVNLTSIGASLDVRDLYDAAMAS